MLDCPVLELPFMDAEDCKLVLNEVEKYKDLWSRRSEELWYTLGPAAYLDAKIDYEKYVNDSKYWNEEIIANSPIFQMGFMTLCKRLKELLKSPVLPLYDAANFGFHIFGEDDRFVGKLGSVHYDREYMHMHLKEAPENHLSFTIPISLPTCGGGLVWWASEGLKSQYKPYELGNLYLHFGDLKHAIAPPMKPLEKGDQRVTIQGHAIKQKGIWYVYR